MDFHPTCMLAKEIVKNDFYVLQTTETLEAEYTLGQPPIRLDDVAFYMIWDENQYWRVRPVRYVKDQVAEVCCFRISGTIENWFLLEKRHLATAGRHNKLLEKYMLLFNSLLRTNYRQYKIRSLGLPL